MDVKPLNMLYKYNEQGLHCEVCDFGDCVPAVPLSARIAGTEIFMAPEVKRLVSRRHNTEQFNPQYADAHSWALSMLTLFFPLIDPDIMDNAKENYAIELQQAFNRKFQPNRAVSYDENSSDQRGL